MHSKYGPSNPAVPKQLISVFDFRETFLSTLPPGVQQCCTELSIFEFNSDTASPPVVPTPN
jgi:hypothetical protein